jgi:hypothetical protein
MNIAKKRAAERRPLAHTTRHDPYRFQSQRTELNTKSNTE